MKRDDKSVRAAPRGELFVVLRSELFDGIRKLPAGHWLSVRDGALTTGEFWRPRYVPKHAGPQSVVLEQLDARLARSVESMLVADVPLGAFVSGGVDSGVIAALATRISGLLTLRK